MKKLKNYPVTLIAVILGGILFLTSNYFGLDLFGIVLDLIESLELRDIHEIVISVMLILLGLVIDSTVNYRHQLQLVTIQTQRLQVLKATMRTVQDIVNNFLNNLQLFRMEAEDALAAESLELFDTLIQETSGKLKALGDLEETHEKSGATGSMMDYPKSQLP